MPNTINTSELNRKLELIIERGKELRDTLGHELSQVHPKFYASAINLIDYLALRQFDIRGLQEQLSYLGLSSLGRAEKNVMASLRAVQKTLGTLSTGQSFDLDKERVLFEQSNRRLEVHIADLLGARQNGRSVRIMVTLPPEAAEEYQLVHDLLASGMDIARINCAHNNEKCWSGMIDNIQRATTALERNCQIVMDLTGPKIRTGQLLPGPGVVRIQPKHDSLGRITSPRLVTFVPQNARWFSKKSTAIPVPQECIDVTSIGDLFSFTDTRGKKRKLAVVDKSDSELRLECRKNAYVATGTKLKLRRQHFDKVLTFRVGTLPPIEEPIVLKTGDTLILHRHTTPGERAVVNAHGSVKKPAHISCKPPEAFDYVTKGDPVRLNDGKIEGTVTAVSKDEMQIVIEYAKTTGSKLRGDKGVNFPDSDIRLRGLTEADKANLGFIVKHADAVSLSFVRKPKDIVSLQQELKQYPASKLGIILKVETVKCFNDLPRLLLATMRHYPAGVMIARGDLAVECGWVRLAEIQEEILWLCEAAQLPVIWATQVLERETKKGQPSRAEITDAAMSQRADCVMLNKGPHILAAIKMLDDILRRMQDHQHKKTPTLRKLGVSRAYNEGKK